MLSRSFWYCSIARRFIAPIGLIVLLSCGSGARERRAESRSPEGASPETAHSGGGGEQITTHPEGSTHSTDLAEQGSPSTDTPSAFDLIEPLIGQSLTLVGELDPDSIEGRFNTAPECDWPVYALCCAAEQELPFEQVLVSPDSPVSLRSWVNQQADEAVERLQSRSWELWSQLGGMLNDSWTVQVGGRLDGEVFVCDEIPHPVFVVEQISGFRKSLADEVVDDVVEWVVPTLPGSAPPLELLELMEAGRSGEPTPLRVQTEYVGDACGMPPDDRILQPPLGPVFIEFESRDVAPTEERCLARILGQRGFSSAAEVADEDLLGDLEDEAQDCAYWERPPYRGFFSGRVRLVRGSNCEGDMGLVIAPIFTVVDVLWDE